MSELLSDIGNAAWAAFGIFLVYCIVSAIITHRHKWGKWETLSDIRRSSDKASVGIIQVRQCETCGLKEFEEDYI